MKKDDNIYKSELFNYGIEFLKKVFDIELGSKATYIKINENLISINQEIINETFELLIKKWKVLANNASSKIFENISRDITDDLIAFGGDDVFYSGMLD